MATQIIYLVLRLQFCVFGLAYCAKTFAPNVAVGIALSHLKLSFYADTSGPELRSDLSTMILLPHSHQSLNMFKSCLVKHGFKIVFFIKAAY